MMHIQSLEMFFGGRGSSSKGRNEGSDVKEWSLNGRAPFLFLLLDSIKTCCSPF